MKQEYYIKYLNYYSPHILIMGIVVAGIILNLSIQWVLVLIFVFWFIRVFLDKKNREYIRKEFDEKKISKKEYYENIKRG